MARKAQVVEKVASQVKKQAKTKIERRKDPGPIFPTGLTTLNLALADTPTLGYRPGTVVNIIGDTHTGKTMLAYNCLAECANTPALDDYLLIYDDAEAAMSFDLGYLFGEKALARIAPPHPKRTPVYSRTVEDFLYGLLQLLDAGIPFIWVEDSLDALSSDDDLEYLDKAMKAWKKGKEPPGTYGTGKAKKMSQLLATVMTKLEQSKSLLIIISQTRDNINPLSFKKKTRAGGRALDFYASIIMWLAKDKTIRVTRSKKQMTIGNTTRVKVDKNKYTGKSRELSFDTFYDYGVDDIGAMFRWLHEYGGWSTVAKALGVKGEAPTSAPKRLKLAKQIEDQGLERRLRKYVAKEWLELERSLLLNRKRRFK